MGDFLTFTIFNSFAWGIIILAVLLVCLLIAEGIEQGGLGLLSILTFMLINYWWGNIPLTKLITWGNVLFYIGAGFVFANIRIYFYGREKAKDKDKSYSEVEENIFRWWFMWPISLIYWTFSSLVIDLWNLIYKRFELIFKFFYNLGVNNGNKK